MATSLGKKVFRQKSKQADFGRGVDALVAKRNGLRQSGLNIEADNFEKSVLAEGRRKLSAKALAKVSKRKVRRFGRDLDDYKQFGVKEPEFVGVSGASGRKLSKKAMAKLGFLKRWKAKRFEKKMKPFVAARRAMTK